MNNDDIRHYVDVKCTEQQVKRWQNLSAATISHSILGDHVRMHNELEAWAKSSSEGAFREVYWHWIGSNLSYIGDNEKAIRALKTSLECGDAEEPICKRNTTKRAVVNLLAALYLSDEKLELALEQYEAMGKISDMGHNSSFYLAGIACERFGNKERAIQYYSKVADENYNDKIDSIHQLAKRNIDRLTNTDHFPKLEGLVNQLSKALLKKDESSLKKLASKTHFRIGLGCHAHFVDVEEVINQLVKDLKKRAISIDKVDQTKETCLIHTSGWRGYWFNGKINFKLYRFSTGWEWIEVTIGANPNNYMKTLAPVKLETNSPLPFTLKAPWDKRNSRDVKTFMAGGIEDPLEWIIQAIEPSSWFDRAVDFLFGDSFLADALNFLSGREIRERLLEFFNPADIPRQIALSTRPCGFGLRGFYYNVATHKEADAFAIDFTDYDGTVEAGEFWPVLSAIDGRVVFTRFDIPNWDDSNANAVEIKSFRSGTEYVSRYLHLANDPNPPVRVNMFASVGTYIGKIQSTGNSVFPHLHFSIHDQSRPHSSGELLYSCARKGRSVRPTIMDGYRLDDDDESTCVESSNGGIPSISISQPRPLEIIPTSTLRVPLTTIVLGGAKPLRITWTSNRESRNPISSETSNFETNNFQSYIFRVPGRQILTATVTDALGRSNLATVAIDVVNSPPGVNIIMPMDGTSFASNEVVLLHGRTRDADIGGALPDSQVFWYLDGSSREFAIGHRGVIPANSLIVGNHRIKFVGSDRGNLIEVEHEFVITPQVSNRRPIVRILNPEDGFIEHASIFDSMIGDWFLPINLAGEADDPEEGPISDDSLVWSFIEEDGSEVEIGRGNRLIHNFYANGGFGTSYRVKLTATDSEGNSSFAVVSITVSLLG